MSQLALGSLCTGYGGLDMAAEALLGTHTVWCAEFEDAPSKVIAARMPGVPNLHDVKRIPWWIVAPVQVLTAGYPCQPFSLAGARLGEDDPRHLWPSIAEGIGVLRPAHVLLENVRGHLSLGFDQVLHDLYLLGYAVSWTILSAGSIGACHRRERLFIYARPTETVAPVAGALIATATVDGWVDGEEDIFGERLPWTGDLPTSGTMYEGAIREANAQMLLPEPMPSGALVFDTPDTMPEAPNSGSNRKRQPAGLGNQVKLLPTATAQDSAGSGGSSEQHVTLTDAVVRTEFGTRPNERLLPSPVAQPSGNSPDDHLRKKPGREVVTDLAIIVENGLLEPGGRLLPTPRANEATGTGVHGTGGQDLRTTVAFLPTPDAYAGSRGGSQDPEKRRAGGHSVALHDVVEKGGLLPTPKAGDADFGMPRTSGRPPEKSTHLMTRMEFTKPESSWGPYAAAIERWEAVLGRPAPDPTEEGPKGGRRLAAPFVEWMMGLPPGRVTDTTLGLSRSHQLKMLGNGVVPPQALAAYRLLKDLVSRSTEGTSHV